MENSNMGAAIAANTFDTIPQANANAKSVTGIVKHSGKVTGYQLSNGSFYTKDECLEMAQNGMIKGVGIAHRGHTQYLKSLPDGSENNNLSSLPVITQ